MSQLICVKCNHVWYPNDPNKKPKVCPKCKRYDWYKRDNENNTKEH